jgi:elongator complex protein 3
MEYFLEYVDGQNRLYALLRLRICNQKAIIREVHTFGQALRIGDRSDKIQHLGLGKKLLQKAEEICQKKQIKTLFIISGVGVRDYYRNLGYRLKNKYMMKHLN